LKDHRFEKSRQIESEYHQRMSTNVNTQYSFNLSMAVPKKRTSKAKKNARKANWKRKSYSAAQKSLSLAKSMLRGRPTSFVYNLYIDSE